MFRKLLPLFALTAAYSIACAGPLGKGEGDECTGDQCSSNLICQPIEGRSVDYCCPAPPTSSNAATCHPGTVDGG
jgi:hypothetical protein